ncbi:oxidoreductase [Streptomyces spiroverticillatus]|uniref:Oxidoreductase n=1 Tax=Streptomyces finlayi TaxID=67296 RepID=A0A918X721_9ACTN|nr:FAD-dependent oxidoreductase [Streptomyces finlayi]GHA46079.1 oxidoreductase [Streptomyces spiroverticillatus]GHD16107.1 oxidoreductase [Streptomyces finlayi]
MSNKGQTDLVVVGAGPAGVAAAVMAASLGMHVVLVEAEQVGSKIRTISALANVPGQWKTGDQLAAAYAADVATLERDNSTTLLLGRAASVSVTQDGVTVALQGGGELSAAAAVIATGVATASPQETRWISAPADFNLAPLWRAAPEDVAGRTYVLGGDRPLGTWLRAHPVSADLYVLVPPEDDYKILEVSQDRRVHVVPISQVTVAHSPDAGSPWLLSTVDRGGAPRSYAVDTVFGNLGSRPAALPGLARGSDGYCPPEAQHPRILVAGDLRASRFQRIVTAQGSGAEAVLARYYDAALPSV